MDPNVQSSTICNSQDMEKPKYLSVEEWIKISLTHMMKHYSVIKRNKAELCFAEMWMDLETVIQNEVNQEEKNKHQW